MAAKLFTIGHSTHPLDRFLTLLTQHGVETLVDIRRFPGSRKFPQFNQDELARALQKANIDYYWLEALGGRRRKQPGSPPTANLGLRNLSFRNYADYMSTPEFRAGVTRLVQLARRRPTAIMCAETLYWRCHRRLVSDFLVAKGIAVEHIMAGGRLRAHTMTPGAVIKKGRLSYPAATPQDEHSHAPGRIQFKHESLAEGPVADHNRNAPPSAG